MKRRNFLRSTLSSGCSALLPLTLGGCTKPVTRDHVLAGIIEGVALPDVHAVSLESKGLSNAVTALNTQPSPETLSKARAAWRLTAATWRQAGSFKQGPLVTTSAFVRATFWPPRKALLTHLMSDTNPVDPTYVKRLGVDLKGIYGLESFLFPANSDDATIVAEFADPSQLRRRQLLEALASDVVNLVDGVKTTLGDGKAAAANFALGGQAYLSQLVTEMVGILDTVAAKRVDAMLQTSKNGTLNPVEVEGSFGGISHLLVEREVTTVSRLYGTGPRDGVGALVHGAAPSIDQSLRERLQAALAAVKGLNEPLERLVYSAPEKLVRARDTAKALDVALKVDVASALGLTLTFQAGDSD